MMQKWENHERTLTNERSMQSWKKSHLTLRKIRWRSLKSWCWSKIMILWAVLESFQKNKRISKKFLLHHNDPLMHQMKIIIMLLNRWKQTYSFWETKTQILSDNVKSNKMKHRNFILRESSWMTLKMRLWE